MLQHSWDICTTLADVSEALQETHKVWTRNCRPNGKTLQCQKWHNIYRELNHFPSQCSQQSSWLSRWSEGGVYSKIKLLPAQALLAVLVRSPLTYWELQYKAYVKTLPLQMQFWNWTLTWCLEEGMSISVVLRNRFFCRRFHPNVTTISTGLSGTHTWIIWEERIHLPRSGQTWIYP